MTAKADIPFWLRGPVVTLLVAVLLAVRFYVADNTGLVRDEAFYALWSRYPELGYLDHPPMVAWLIALGRWVGDDTAGIRLFSVASSALISFAVYRTGRILFDARTAGLAVIWLNLTLALGLLILATPDAPMVTFWSLAVWAVAEFVARRNANWWLLAGLFAGLALLSKYTAAFLGIGLVLYLVTSRERRQWLRLWQLWAGGALAILIWVPNLIWNATHGWASFAYQGRRLSVWGTSVGGAMQNFGELLAGQMLAMGPALFILMIVAIALFAMRRDRPGRANLALPVFVALPLLAYFVLYTARFRVEANWPLPVWPMLSLAGAWAAVHLRPRHWLAAAPMALLRWVQAPLGAVVVTFLYIQALWHPFVLDPLVDRTSEMRGWEELEREVASQAERIGVKWIASGRWDYGLTGGLDLYGRWAGSTLPVRPINVPERWGFLPPLDSALVDEPALLVTTIKYGTLEDVLLHFAEAELVGEVGRREGEIELERFYVYRVRGPLAETRAVLGQR